MEMSKLQVYSIGLVVVDKLLDTHIIEVVPQEDSPMVNGELTDHKADYKAKGQDQDGGKYEVTVATTLSVKAVWLPIHSMNRKTAPDVRRGERVILYRYADSDFYFWATLWDDLHLRKLETAIYVFSGTKEEGAPINADNYYFMEISTHKKVVHFHTSKANGEPFSYDVQIDSGNGIVTIQDDAGNVIQLESKERIIQMVNGDGSIMEVNKKNINLKCSDTITVESKNLVQKHTDMKISTSTISEQAGSGDIVVQGISHVHHVHAGVRAGPDDTGQPK